jgi:hypothetical protein
MKWLITE